MKKVAVLLALASIVGGAKAGVVDDLAQTYITQAGLDRLTAVLAPGAENEVLIGGKPMLVTGSSTCPKRPLPDSIGIWAMGMSNDKYSELYVGRPGCVVIGPSTASVSVVLYDKVNGHITKHPETWTVQHGLPHHADAIVLKRPNGEYVAAAR